MVFLKLDLHDFRVCLSLSVGRGAFTVFCCAEKITVSFSFCSAAL